MLIYIDKEFKTVLFKKMNIFRVLFYYILLLLKAKEVKEKKERK